MNAFVNEVIQNPIGGMCLLAIVVATVMGMHYLAYRCRVPVKADDQKS